MTLHPLLTFPRLSELSHPRTRLQDQRRSHTGAPIAGRRMDTPGLEPSRLPPVPSRAGPGRSPGEEQGRAAKSGGGWGGGRPRPVPAVGRGSPQLGTPARRDRVSLSSQSGGERGPGLNVRCRTSGAAQPPHLSATLSSGRRGRSAPRTHWATAAMALSCPPAASARPPRPANQRAGGPGVTGPEANQQADAPISRAD